MLHPISRLERSLELSRVPNPITGSAAVFLWGARQTGKITFLHERYERAAAVDM